MKKTRRLMRNNNFFYSNVLNSVVFYCELVEKVKFLWIKQFCIQAMSKEFLDIFFLWGGEGHAQKPTFCFSEKKTSYGISLCSISRVFH